MNISKFNEEYSKKLDEYINEYTIYLDDDKSTDDNLIKRNKELQDITTKFMKNINTKSGALDVKKAKLEKDEKKYQEINAHLLNSQHKSEENKDSVVMLKKKEKNLVENHQKKNKIIKPLFYVNCFFGFFVLVGALYITENRLLLWFMEFISNLALDIYLSLGTLAQYILNTIFGLSKKNRKNRNNINTRNTRNRKNNSITNNTINNTN